MDVDLPGKDMAADDIAHKNTAFAVSIEWNVSRKKLELSNKHEDVFERQLNQRAFCIASGFDNLPLHDLLKDMGFKKDRDFIYQDRSEHETLANYYFTPKGVKKLIETGRIDFDKLPNFEGKFALVRNISSKMTIAESRSWAERVAALLPAALADESVSLNGEHGFVERPSDKTDKFKSYKIRHWPIFDRAYHDPERY